jgi:hypothetical protein
MIQARMSPFALRHSRSTLPSRVVLKSLGRVSSSMMSTVAVEVPSTAADGDESVTVKVCLPSIIDVLRTATVKVLDVSFARKLIVPEAVV